MEVKRTIRRQKHGIRAEQITVTLPGDEMEKLRERAASESITVSKLVAELIIATQSVGSNGQSPHVSA